MNEHAIHDEFDYTIKSSENHVRVVLYL